MIRINEVVEIPASATCVWECVGDFHNPQRWTLGIDEQRSSPEGPRAVRRLRMGSTEIAERLELRDPKARTLSYSFLAGSLPVSEFTSTLHVRSLGPQNCRVEWSAACMPLDIAAPKLRSLLGKAYRRNLAHLAGLFAAHTPSP